MLFGIYSEELKTYVLTKVLYIYIYICVCVCVYRASLVTQTVKRLSAMKETRVQSLG